MNLFGSLEDNELVLKEGVLTYSHLPETVLFREQEQNVIASAIKPLLSGRKPDNLFVYGKPGLGKTLCTKTVLQQLQNYSSDVLPIYINCWDANREYQVFTEIAKQTGYFFFQGKSAEDVFDEIVKRAEKSKGVCFVFDEIDKVRDLGFLYKILQHLEDKASVVLITNDKDFLMNLEARILSRLTPNELKFRAYSLEEIKEILGERVRLAFKPGAVSHIMLNKIAYHTHRSEDIRVGLFLLLNAAKNAEQSGHEKISNEDLDAALSKLAQFKIKTSLSKLSTDEQLLIDLVSKFPGLISGELFQKYSDAGGTLTMRSYRRMLMRLSRLELLSLENTSKGFRGQSRKILLGKKLKYTRIDAD
ncbi:hypothetical protein COT72_02435 [archaeon CG10_big_fil_rev_8_21_14_0_10_43_11]|nr:MAG: hypothetical protein COT72_02435 [archaeon CG10_big_fil_rev_8_21_14_0_10_43_11]